MAKDFGVRLYSNPTYWKKACKVLTIQGYLSVNRQIDAVTSQSLVLRLRDHSDTGAWTEFVDVYSPLIYDFCRMRLLQPSDAADVTQEVLLRVAKGIKNFEYDKSRGLFRDWLARIVINEVRRFGKASVEVVSTVGDWNQDAGKIESTWNDQFQEYIFAKAMQRCKTHFAQDTWTMFERTWIEKSPADQVALELGVRVEQIYVARSRVLKRLKHEVAILADDALL